MNYPPVNDIEFSGSQTFREMRIGESIFAVGYDANRLRGNAKTYKHRYPGWYYLLQRVSGGIRLWRISAEDNAKLPPLRDRNRSSDRPEPTVADALRDMSRQMAQLADRVERQMQDDVGRQLSQRLRMFTG